MLRAEVGEFVHNVEELLARLRGKCDLIVSRTEYSNESFVFMVLVDDGCGQEQTVWSVEVDTSRPRRSKQYLVQRAARTQDNVAAQVLEMVMPEVA